MNEPKRAARPRRKITTVAALNARGAPPPEPSLDDPDNPEWTEEDFARARPASEVLPPEIVEQLVRKRGRPPKPEGERKEAVKLRLSPEVLEHFRSGGPGWQTRIDDALKRVAAGKAGE